MKVITKHVIIDNNDYALISDNHEGRTYYGTIPYTEVDENGLLKKELNGHDMCISFVSIADAIEERKNRIKIEKYEAEGHTKAEVMMYVISGYTAENWDEELFERFKAVV